MITSGLARPAVSPPSTRPAKPRPLVAVRDGALPDPLFARLSREEEQGHAEVLLRGRRHPVVGVVSMDQVVVDVADDHVDLWVGKRVEIELSHPDTYQLDGDVEGECRRMVAEVDPGSLVVCLPV